MRGSGWAYEESRDMFQTDRMQGEAAQSSMPPDILFD